MSLSIFRSFLETDKKALLSIFLLFTVIASIQFTQYFIAYNSSYPFPWKSNLIATYGLFYSYFLFVPLIFKSTRWINNESFHLGHRLLLHSLTAVMVGAIHLLVVQLMDWAQTYRFAEATFVITYRWRLARWLHLEILAYIGVVSIPYWLEQVRRQKEIKESSTTMIDPSQEYPKQIKVKESGDIEYIPIESVLWIEAYDNYIKLHVSGRFYLLRQTLSSIEQRLDPRLFQRIHRSYIVAVKQVERLKTKGGNYEVMLKEGTTLKLSRTYRIRLESLLEMT